MTANIFFSNSMLTVLMNMASYLSLVQETPRCKLGIIKNKSQIKCWPKVNYYLINDRLEALNVDYYVYYKAVKPLVI